MVLQNFVFLTDLLRNQHLNSQDDFSASPTSKWMLIKAINLIRS